MTLRTIRRALLSVSDKTGLIDLAKALSGFGVELISTGGTRKSLADAGLAVRDISEVTGFPEMLDGRVKTLHPCVHGGILAIRDNPEHQATVAKEKIGLIDLVVCNLYPFEETVAKPGATHEDIIENIDIGGPSMVRSAAKNYHDVAIVTDPRQYAEIIKELKANGGALTLLTREGLAAVAFARTAEYDQAISDYFIGPPEDDGWPNIWTIRFKKLQKLRYGENPHQQAAFYVEPGVRRGSIPSPCGRVRPRTRRGRGGRRCLVPGARRRRRSVPARSGAPWRPGRKTRPRQRGRRRRPAESSPPAPARRSAR